MDTFIQLPNGQRVNKKFASAGAVEGLSSGLYKEVNEGGLPVLAGEPTVLSSESGKKNFESKIQPSIDKANANLTTVTQNTANKPEPEEKETLPADIQAEIDGVKSPEELLFEKQMESINRQIEGVKQTFAGLTTMATNSSQAQINSLTQQWHQRRGAVNQSNRDNLRSWENIFARTGRYTPGTTAEFLTAKEMEGISKLQEVDVEYNTKIAAINAALEKELFSKAAELTTELNTLETKSLEYLKDLTTETSKVNKEIKDKQIKASRDMAIAGLVEQGITDPAEVMAALNEAAVASGYESGDFTAEEIEKTLKALAPEDKLEKLSGATRDFYILKSQGLLPSTVTSLPEDQQLFAYLKQEKAASSVGSGKGGSITLSEAKTLGLPISTVGMNEDEILATLQSSNPPEWFRERLQNELQMSVAPDALKEAWNEFRGEVIDTAEGIKETEKSNDYKKARSYFDSTYEGLDDGQLDTIAAEVERKVNGGLSYADAVSEVEEELK